MTSAVRPALPVAARPLARSRGCSDRYHRQSGLGAGLGVGGKEHKAGDPRPHSWWGLCGVPVSCPLLLAAKLAVPVWGPEPPAATCRPLTKGLLGPPGPFFFFFLNTGDPLSEVISLFLRFAFS